MAESLVTFERKPNGRYLIAGWQRQWSDGGGISGGLPEYLIDKMSAEKIGEMNQTVSELCYPFQVAGTHDTYRPITSYLEGLPASPLQGCGRNSRRIPGGRVGERPTGDPGPIRGRP